MSLQIDIGDQTFVLDDDVDITELKSEIVRNVHAGGGWVAIKTGKGGTVEVFVSRGQYMSIREANVREGRVTAFS